MIALDSNFPNKYGVISVETLETLYFGAWNMVNLI